MSEVGFIRKLRVIAVVTLCMWIAISVASKVSARAEFVCAILLAILLAACWIGSVWLWTRVSARTGYHFAALPLLVLFGFVWGWAYILAAAGSFDATSE